MQFWAECWTLIDRGIEIQYINLWWRRWSWQTSSGTRFSFTSITTGFSLYSENSCNKWRCYYQWGFWRRWEPSSAKRGSWTSRSSCRRVRSCTNIRITISTKETRSPGRFRSGDTWPRTRATSTCSQDKLRRFHSRTKLWPNLNLLWQVRKQNRL
jgi:hypothetical protein